MGHKIVTHKTIQALNVIQQRRCGCHFFPPYHYFRPHLAVPAQHTTPEQRRLCLPCTSSGCINAIAFWFELQLDNEVTCTAQGARKLIKGDLAQMDPQSTGATSSSKPPAAPAAPAETETETAATAVGGFSQNALCTGPLNCQPGSRTWQVREWMVCMHAHTHTHKHTRMRTHTRTHTHTITIYSKGLAIEASTWQIRVG